MIRFSSSAPGCYTISSVDVNGRVLHQRVTYSPKKGFEFWSKTYETLKVRRKRKDIKEKNQSMSGGLLIIFLIHFFFLFSSDFNQKGEKASSFHEALPWLSFQVPFPLSLYSFPPFVSNNPQTDICSRKMTLNIPNPVMLPLTMLPLSKPPRRRRKRRRKKG